MAKAKARKKSPLLGTIRTKVVGLQYHESEPAERMPANLERERDNGHDENAIRVDNAEFETLGHLPRKVVTWLAPLIDSGKVRVKGVLGTGAPFEHSAPLDLKISLAAKGKSILKRAKSPNAAPVALHQMVLGAYLDSETWEDPKVILDLTTYLRSLKHHDILPETRLLVELMPGRAKELRRKQGAEECRSVAEALRSLKIGKRQYHHNLTVFPLYAVNGHKPGYMLLSEALEKDLAEVTEVSDEGSVPELRLTNHAPIPILVPEGEIVVGGKQNRTVNISVLVEPAATISLAVSCVEAGRWNRVSERFRSEHHAPPRLRANKLRAVRARRVESGRNEGDQNEVWADVDDCLAASGANSETGSLTDAYEHEVDRIAGYRKKITLTKKAEGVLVLHGDEVVGLDLFGHHKTFEAIWPRLAEAYFFGFAGKDGAQEAAPAQAKALISKVADNLSLSDEAPGLGQAYDVEADDLIGSALWYEGRPCHVAAFPV